MMRSQRVRNRSRNATPTISAAFAFADVVVEATKRGLRRNPLTTAAEEAMASSSGQVFVILGRELEDQRRRLLDADDRYQELRTRLRHLRRRRDEAAGHAYRGLVAARKVLKGLFGYEGACGYLGLRGPTKREPPDLNLQLGDAVWWAHNYDAEIEPFYAGAEEEAEDCVAYLEQLHGQLDHALRDAGQGARETEAAMLDQRAAMTEFDHTYQHVAGALEAKLIEVGLPTLAAAVRPGVGRCGRPLKRRPVDRYPDLVEEVRLRDLIGLELEDSISAGNGAEVQSASLKSSSDGSARDLASRPAAGDRDAADGTVSTGARNDSAQVEIIEQPLPKRSTDEEKTERLLPERSGDEEIIQHAIHECSGDDEKSRHLVRKQTGGDSKIETPLHKSSTRRPSTFVAALTLLPPVSACGRDPHHRDLGPSGYRVERRPGGPAAGRSPLKKMRKVTAAWWQRLVRAA